MKKMLTAKNLTTHWCLRLVGIPLQDQASEPFAEDFVFFSGRIGLG